MNIPFPEFFGSLDDEDGGDEVAKNVGKRLRGLQCPWLKKS